MSGHSKRGNVSPTGMFPWIFHGDIFQYRDESRKTTTGYSTMDTQMAVRVFRQFVRR